VAFEQLFHAFDHVRGVVSDAFRDWKIWWLAFSFFGKERERKEVYLNEKRFTPGEKRE
jgi:hypothetical protein